MARFREGLEVAGKYTFLNHASCGPLHSAVRRAAARCLGEQRREASLADPGWQEFMPKARSSAARLIGAETDSVCLMPNCALGLIRALSSISFRKGDEVLYLQHEFATLYFALQGVLKYGAVLREVRVPARSDPTDAIIAAITPRTRLVAISWVGFLLGKRVDLRRLCEEKQRRGFYLIVDGYQGVGVVPLKLSELCVDFFVCGGAKWLMSPLGSGFFYASEEILEGHYPDWPGWFGMEIDQDRYCNRDVPARSTAVRFETGTEPLASMYGMKRAIDEFNAIGVPAIWRRIQELTALLLEGLKELPVSIQTPEAADKRAGIITFAVEDARNLMDVLNKERIVVSLRDGLIRVSPHFWNNEEDIHLFVRVLNDFAR